MSVSEELKNIITTDDYGVNKVNLSMASHFWGENELPKVINWVYKAKIPQLETLIEIFNGTDIAIAGGAILGSFAAVEYGDIDVFPLKSSDIILAEKLLTKIGYKCINDQPHSKSYKRAGSSQRIVQVITIHIDTNADINKLLNRFDLSVCQLGILNKKLYTNTTTLRDINKKILRVRSTISINSLISRLKKYEKRGFRLVDAQKENKNENINNNNVG